MAKFPKWFKIKYLRKIFFQYVTLLLLLGFATVQFFLILRHKSPYLSDSYFYKHIYYQLQGSNYQEAYQKIISEIDLKQADPITKNIFENPNVYQNSFSFFTKRPLYPFLAYLLNFVVISDYLSFLIPVFASYLGVILFTFYFASRGINYFFGTLATAFLISVYPFLDWSTYFLTDTIGAFFWLLQIFFIYRFVSIKKRKWLVAYIATFIISLFNREQSLLMFLLLSMFYLLTILFKFSKDLKNKISILTLSTVLIVFTYIIISFVTKQRTLIESIIYTQNSYGFYQKEYSPQETFLYVINNIKLAHAVFLKDLVRHHWWFTFSLIAMVGIIRVYTLRKKELLDLLMLSSGFASYLFIFVYPVLSYRFFFPVIIALIYFSSKFIWQFYKERDLIFKSD